MWRFFDFIAPVYEALRPGARGTFCKLIALTAFRPSDIVVDIGGGTGAIAQFLSGRVARMIVIDPSEKMLAQCRHHVGLECILGHSEALPFNDRSIDKIILVDAFHHLSDRTAALSEIRRVLKQNGIVIVVEFNPESIGGTIIALFEKILRFGSVFFTPDQLLDLFTDHGFSCCVKDDSRTTYYLLAQPHNGFDPT